MKTPIRRGLVLAVTTLLVALAGIAQQVPDTAAEKQFSAWLAAFNNGDRATLLQYLEKNYPQRAPEIDGVMEFRAMTGGFELKKVESSEATKFMLSMICLPELSKTSITSRAIRNFTTRLIASITNQ